VKEEVTLWVADVNFQATPRIKFELKSCLIEVKKTAEDAVVNFAVTAKKFAKIRYSTLAIKIELLKMKNVSIKPQINC